MATVEHADIIDPQIHEPKGITTAAANRVYVSDGDGSGSWSRVPLQALTDSVNAFSSQLLHVQQLNIQPTNVSRTWYLGRLDTVVQNDISATLVDNTLTLPSGTYIVDGIAQQLTGSDDSTSNVLRARLYNSTLNTAIIEGTSDVLALSATSHPPSPYYSSVHPLKSFIKGRFTLNTTSSVNLQLFLGNSVYSLIEPDYKVIHNLMFWKVA